MPEFRLQILREGIRWLDAVLFTHSHADHVFGTGRLPALLRSARRDRPADLCQRKYDGRFAARLPYAFTGQPAPKGYFIPEPHIVNGPFALGDLEIVPLALPHGRAGTNGYLFLQARQKTPRLFERLQGSAAGGRRAGARGRSRRAGRRGASTHARAGLMR